MFKKAVIFTTYIWALTMIGITVWALLITEEMIDFGWDKFAVTTSAQFIVGVPVFYFIGKLALKKKNKTND